MNTFTCIEEKLDFLKKYKLASAKETVIPTLYYYASGSDAPITCEVIGYEQIYDSWAIITIKAGNNTINIHSNYLLDMKKRGTEYHHSVNTTSDDISSSSDSDLHDSYIVFDIETTGINRNKDEIIEIAAIKYIGKKVFEFHEYVKINSTVPINITLLTGISNETIADADPIDVVIPKFLSFIGNCLLVGHNIKSFDIPFINKVCADLGLCPIKNELTDTLYLSKEKFPELDNYKLPTLCSYLGVDTSSAHHALFDCYMCNSLYHILISDDAEVLTASNLFQEKVLSILEKIIIKKELPNKGLRLRENKNKNIDSYSVLISEPPYPLGSDRLGGEQSIMKISVKSEGYDIDILLNVFEHIKRPNNISYKVIEKKGNSPQHVVVSFASNDIEVYSYIESVILYRLSQYRTAEPTFSCCSKFNQCSDAKKCVHENKLYSTACTYRKNLESGRIFYGKNRNID